MSAPLHIGALSARTGHSVHTIRWYEAQGLMPGVQRDGGGRRVYADGHVGWLELMQRLRRTGTGAAGQQDSFLRAVAAHGQTTAARLVQPRAFESTEQTSMSTSDNKQALQHVFEAMAVGNTRPFGDLMADDCVWFSPGQSVWSGTWRGKKAMGEQLFAPLYKRFEGKYTNHAVRFIAEGDVVVVEARGRAKLKGGGEYNNTYCFICEFNADGKITQVTEYMDTDLAVRVLGAPAAQAAA